MQLRQRVLTAHLVYIDHTPNARVQSSRSTRSRPSGCPPQLSCEKEQHIMWRLRADTKVGEVNAE